MRLYAVYVKPEEEPAFVREGFCWPALFVAPFWAIGHGMWLAAVALLVSLGVLVALPIHFELDAATRAVLIIGWALYAGTSGNDWRRLSLERRGYGLADVLIALDRAHAMMRFSARSEGPHDAHVAGAAPAGAGGPALDLGPSPGFWS